MRPHQATGCTASAGESHPLVYQDLAEFPELARRVFGDPAARARKTPACTGRSGVRDPRAAQADA